MRILMLAAAVGAGGAVAARAECGDALAALRDDPAIMAATTDADPDIRRRLRAIVATAEILATAGYDMACMAVTTAVRDMAERNSLVSADAAAAAREEADMPSWSEHDYAERAKTATAFAGLANRVSSSMIVGADARLINGDGIGAVEGFLTDDEGISHLIVGYGGFLSLGDREIAVPVGRVSYDPENEVFYIDTTHDWFDTQPDWDQAGWAGGADAWKRDSN